ncbi:hypothetical protein ABZ806_17445 [Spirillospora sp. NPDC047418]
MSTTPREGGRSAVDELRDAYREQLNRLAAERDAARRQARTAQARADVARADLASLQSRVRELLTAAARHLPDLPAADPPDVAGPARAELTAGDAPEPPAAPDAPGDDAVRPERADRPEHPERSGRPEHVERPKHVERPRRSKGSARTA